MSDREELAETLLSGRWPNGDLIEAVTRRTAPMIADAILASDWLARHVAAIGERIALAIEAERLTAGLGLTEHQAYNDGLGDAARIACTTETLTYDGFGAPIVEEGQRVCGCWSCHEARGQQISHMIICPTCGNKRCPHAADHRNDCTGSNEPGQQGSAYEHGSGAASVRRLTGGQS